MKHLTEEAAKAARITYDRAKAVYEWAFAESEKDPENEHLRDVRGETYAVYDLAAHALRLAEQANGSVAHAEGIRAWYVERGLPLPSVNPTGVAQNRDGTLMLPPVILSEVGGDPEDRL